MVVLIDFPARNAVSLGRGHARETWCYVVYLLDWGYSTLLTIITDNSPLYSYTHFDARTQIHEQYCLSAYFEEILSRHPAEHWNNYKHYHPRSKYAQMEVIRTCTPNATSMPTQGCPQMDTWWSQEKRKTKTRPGEELCKEIWRKIGRTYQQTDHGGVLLWQPCVQTYPKWYTGGCGSLHSSWS